MQPRNYKKRPKGQVHDSKQEAEFAKRYPQFLHHPPVRIGYILEAEYLPDFKLGVDLLTGFNVYLELKELWTGDMNVKYKAVVESNNRMILIIMAKSIYEKDLARVSNYSDRLFIYRSNAVLPPEWLTRIHPAVQPNVGDEHED